MAFYREAAELGRRHDRPEVTAFASNSLADILIDQGKVDEAERAIATARRLSAPGSPAAANARLRQGHVASMRGDSAGALAAWRDAAAELEVLARSHSEPLILYNIGVAHGLSSDLLREMNDAGAAWEENLKSRAAIQRLVDAHPDEAQWLRALSLTSDRMAYMKRDAGDLDAAEAAFRTSLGLAERLAVLDPSNEEWQSDLAITLRDLAQVAGDRGRLAEAVELVERALAIHERVCARNPGHVDYLQILGGIHFDRALLLAKADRREEAVRGMRRTVELRREEVTRLPDQAQYRFELARALTELGELLAGRQPEPARASLLEAQGILQRLVARDDSTAAWREALALAERGLARLRGPTAAARPR
jgi:tetratricopeptide (TPR) repeat protein